jgi:hypothetical protein
MELKKLMLPNLHKTLRSEEKLEIEYDEFNFDQLNPKDRILKKRGFKTQIKKISVDAEKNE